MPSTPPVLPVFSFASDPAPQDLINAAQVDTLNANLCGTLNNLIGATGSVIRSDNLLMDQIVRLYTLHPEVLAAIAADGWQPKVSVQAATTTALPAYTVDSTFTILTATSNGALPSQDGIAPIAGQSLLVQSESVGTNDKNNGIYVITQVGSVSTPWILTRRSDANTPFLLGYAFVSAASGGTLNGGATYLSTVASSSITLGTTSIPWVQVFAQNALQTISHGGTGAVTAAQAVINLGVNAYSVATITALRLFAVPVTTSYVFMRGYLLAGDGGEGFFVWNATSTTADNGGTIIQVSGVATGRWTRVYTSGPVNVRWFGATGNGVSNDTTGVTGAITWAISNGIKNVYIPGGTYIILSSITINQPITLIGDGDGFEANFAYPQTIGTTLKWANGSALPFITFSLVNFGGWGMQDINLDCNTIASVALTIADCIGGYFRNVSAWDFTTRGLWCRSLTTSTNSWHTFVNMNIDMGNSNLGAGECIRLSGTVGLANVCHCSFTNTRIGHYGNGIVLAGCDNISFKTTYIQRTGGTGNGVFVDVSEAPGPPSNCVFLHLEAGPGGFWQPTVGAGMSSLFPAVSIYGYALDNGQPLPAFNSAPGFCITSAGQIIGVSNLSHTGSPGKTFTIGTSISSGNSTLAVTGLAEPDSSYFVSLEFSQDPQFRYWITSKTATGFTINFSSAVSGSVNFVAVLSR